MRKAEERAREAYPFSEGKVQGSFGTISFDQHHDEREGFIKGYEQAEKDNAELIKLADAMYYAAQSLTTDASRLHKAMEAYHQYRIQNK